MSRSYVAAVKEALSAAGVKAPDIVAIAAHGQTLFHEAPLTIQYLDPSLVAHETGIAVVSDFRRADVAELRGGGEGSALGGGGEGAGHRGDRGARADVVS